VFLTNTGSLSSRPVSIFFTNEEHPMSFLSQIMGLIPASSRARQQRRSRDRRCSPIALEALEGRALLSITGVSVTNGNLYILASKGSSNNSAEVQIDPKTHLVEVTLNGQSEEFPSSTPIYSVSYVGGSGGGDTFIDDTSLESREYGYGTGNSFTGGTDFNYVWFLNGGGNTFTSTGATSVSDVWEFGGVGSDKIDNDGGTVLLYDYA
jgi:hypothetical protein